MFLLQRAWGACIDWRRSFVTTDANPYYDSFVRWQYNTLKAQNRFIFSKRFAIWAPKEAQPCADHERASGEGVLPQDYTLIKMKVLQVPASISQVVGKRNLFFVAGTMRPETMYGQTNCWVKPDGDYGVFEIDADTLFVCSDRSAHNMSFQGQSLEFGKKKQVARIHGSELIGTPLSSPNCTFERIYALPMASILMTKATGIVTSVPSDAPDDWQNLYDLQHDAEWRKKCHVKDEWVLPFKPVPIIRVPELGEMAAETACKAEGVKSRNDAAALKKAKATVYNLGFHSGVMTVGKYANQTVEHAKPLLRAELIASGQAVAYSEPADVVISRSGEECVVALTDQWSITYGEPSWRDPILEHVKDPAFTTYSEECRLNLVRTLEWMPAWAVSRTYGLGTRVPWDEQYLIESLSDSTVYMAYYTIAHYLHSDLYGKAEGEGKISAKQMTHAVWDYVLLGKTDAALPAGVDKAVLDRMKAEFNYWYPWDLRCSGRDLLQNHLTMSLYHHAALFPKEQWPRGIRACGFMLLNEQKMAKSTGNFLTLSQALEKFGCDAMRLCLSRAGDAMTDGNFNEHEADQAILTLHTLLTWARETMATVATLRGGEYNFFDQLIDEHMNTALATARDEFAETAFRAGIEGGFNFLLLNWKVYLGSVGDLGLNIGPHQTLVRSYVRNLAILLAPVCPHLAEELWTTSGGEGFVVNVRWPQTRVSNTKLLARMDSYFEDLCKEIRRLHKLASAKRETKLVRIFICASAPAWQTRLAEVVAGADKGLDFASMMKLVTADPVVSTGGKAAKKILPNLVKQAMVAAAGGGGQSGGGGGDVTFNELEFLAPLRELIAIKVGLAVEIYELGAEGAPPTKGKPQPNKPSISFIDAAGKE